MATIEPVWIRTTFNSGSEPSSLIIAFTPSPLEAPSAMPMSSASPGDVAIVGCVVGQVPNGRLTTMSMPPGVEGRVLRHPAQPLPTITRSFDATFSECHWNTHFTWP